MVNLERCAEADVFRSVVERLHEQIAALAVADAAQIAAGKEWGAEKVSRRSA